MRKNKNLKKLMLFAIAAFMLLGALTLTPEAASCDYSVKLYDTYGDGWNGNYLDVYVAGSWVMQCDLLSGTGPATYTFTVNDGDTIFLDYVDAGSWEYENVYEVYDSGGVLLATISVGSYPNYGDADWTGVGSCAAPVIDCYFEDAFNAGNLNLWTTNGVGWSVVSSANAGGVAPEARMYWGSAEDGEYLQSLPVDTSVETDLWVTFRSMIDWYGAGTSCYVEMTPNGGSSWIDITPWPNPITGNVVANRYLVNCPGAIGTQTSIRFRFAGDPFYIDYWYVDNVKICDFIETIDAAVLKIIQPDPYATGGWTNLIPVQIRAANNGNTQKTLDYNVKISHLQGIGTIYFQNFDSAWTSAAPPTGWQILDYGSQFPKVWDNNDWYRYTSYSGCPRVYYTPGEIQDEWMISPSANCGLASNVHLTLGYHYYYRSSTCTNARGYIEGSTDGGINFPYLIDTFGTVSGSNSGAKDYTLAWAAFQPNVKIRFRFVNPTSGCNAYWYFNDFTIMEPQVLVTDYDQWVNGTVFAKGEIRNILFPDWPFPPSNLYTVTAKVTPPVGDEVTTNNVLTIANMPIGPVDAQLVSIDNPVSKMAASAWIPKVTVTQNSAWTGLDVPVTLAVYEQPFTSVWDTKLTEDFEGYIGGFNEVPRDAYRGIQNIRGDEKTEEGKVAKAQARIDWYGEPNLGSPGQWTIIDANWDDVTWNPTNVRANQGTASMWMGDPDTDQYPVNSEDWLISPPINAGDACNVIFDMYYDVEYYWDYMELLWSPDLVNWNGYWFPFNYPAWINDYALSAFDPANMIDDSGTVYVAFVFFSDSSVTQEGLYLDDIKIQGSAAVYSETKNVKLNPGETKTITFPAMSGLAWEEYYVCQAAVEHPRDLTPANNELSLLFDTVDIKVYNERTGEVFDTIQEGIDDSDTLGGDTIIARNGTFVEDIVINKQITVTGEWIQSTLDKTNCIWDHDHGSFIQGTVDIVEPIVLPPVVQWWMIEDFERGTGWVWQPWKQGSYMQDSGDDYKIGDFAAGTVTPAAAHDGAYGLSDGGSTLYWTYRTDISVGQPGDKVSAWFYKTATGRSYLGFGATTTGCWALVLGYNTNTILLYSSTYAGSNTQYYSGAFTFTLNKWYRAEVVFNSATSITCNIYDSNGATVLYTFTYNSYTGSTTGGVAVRMFGGSYVDTIEAYGLPQGTVTGLKTVLQKFDITPNQVFTSDDAAVGIYTSNVTVQNCTIHNVRGLVTDTMFTIKGVHIYGEMDGPGIADIIVQNNTIRDILNENLTGGSGGVGPWVLLKNYVLPTGGTETWLFDSLGLSAYYGKNVQFAWQYTSNDEWGCYIDDVAVGSINEGFESPVEPTTSLPPGWTQDNVDGQNDFWQNSNYKKHNGAQSAEARYDVPNNDWLISPEVTIPSGDTLDFWYIDDDSWDVAFALYVREILPAVQYTYGGADGVMVQGNVTRADVLNNKITDILSAGWCYGAEVTPTVELPLGSFADVMLLDEGFEGSWIPSGWTEIPTSSEWQIYTSPAPIEGVQTAGLWWTYYAQDEMLTTPTLDFSAGYTAISLSFETYHYIQASYVEHDYVKISTDGGSTWTTLRDLGQEPSNFWATPIVEDLSSYIGQSNVKIAFHRVTPDGGQGIWFVDDVEVLATEGGGPGPGPGPTPDNVPKDVTINCNYFKTIGDDWNLTYSGTAPYPGVMVSIDQTIYQQPAYANEITMQCNYFDNDCHYYTYAVVNKDPMHDLDARYNYWGQVDGPASDPIFGPVQDPITGYIANGRGCNIVNYGLVRFDPWLGIHANIFRPIGPTITVEAGKPVTFDATGSFAYCFPQCPECCHEEPQDLQYLWDFDHDHLYSSSLVATHIFNVPGTYHVSLMVDSAGFPYHNNFMYDWAYITVTVVPADEDFSANADGGNLGGYEGTVGEPITFYGSAFGGKQPYLFTWDFGDGIVYEDIVSKGTTVSQVTHIYEGKEGGTYTVTLTVLDWNGDIVTDTSDVTVYGTEELLVNIGGQTNIAQGDQLKLTSTVTGGKVPYTYSWNFGDGIISTEANPVHIYENSGTYTVTLTVTDSNNNQKTKTKTITVKESTDTSEVEIKDVKGGLLLKATIVSDIEVSWTINVEGRVFIGGTADGTAEGVTQIRLPFTIAIGNVDITITAGTKVKQYTAFMFGPILLNLKEA